MPVMVLINKRISQEMITPTNPIKAMVRVWLAAAAFLLSPLEVRYLNPPEINMAKKTKPAMGIRTCKIFL